MTQVLKYVDNIAIIKYFKYYAKFIPSEKGTFQATIRERPFNLKKGGNILIPNVAEKNILIVVQGKEI